MTQDDLYRTVVLQRTKTPLYAGKLAQANAQGQGTNPLCGDRVHLHAVIDAQGRIDAIRHETRGCAICAASADLMAERVTGQEPARIRQLHADMEAAVQTGNAPAALGELSAFAPLHRHRSRIRCAMLPWTALMEMLNDDKDR
ncbi:SUF system NifU family Fe-S cluster assembly protein [Komagataeibacter melaceti]|uniref:SUF system NifU family Fe-S cluster assembly protein n=1 Tax=Komagataeibacter melaceti TaxID=2766577 RepID=A0A371Z2D3_9PROT|nr:SUF system NifU family Fe-S cluster assembly protein [Komagataeibacter melaceti]RFD20674.1 SUF system NifU family Fe-S cluster assembly protein [Komagataeibacter melaceti]